MNLQNKTEFKKFVKSKMEGGYNVALISNRKALSAWANISIEIKKGTDKASCVDVSLEIVDNIEVFKKHCRWLTECEDETYIHYLYNACGVELNASKYKYTIDKSKVTCKRCKIEMEKGK